MSDPFDGLAEELGDIFDAVEEEDLTQHDSVTLANMIAELTEELLAAGEALAPASFEAREKHSKRNACQIILRSRGVQV